MRNAFGGVVVRDNEVLIRRPTGEFDGYVWTFGKGSSNVDETSVQTALREVAEETGARCAIVRRLGETILGATSLTTYYLMRPVHMGFFDRYETEAVLWVPLTKAHRWISQTRNARGRARDLEVLARAIACVVG